MKARSDDRVLLGGFSHVEGKCWAARISEHAGLGDDPEHPKRSSLLLMEDGQLLGPGHALHRDIVEKGRGLYSHWGDTLYFSTTDGSDPNTNGRAYEILLPGRMLGSDELGWLLSVLLDFKQASDEETRFSALESLVAKVWPDHCLADWGRDYVEDHRLRELYSRFEKSCRSYDRKYNAYQMIALVREVEGDLVECGVYKGAMARFICQAMVDQRIQARLHLVDSFQGLSEPGRNDGVYWQAGDMKGSLEEVRENLSDMEFVEYHQGWIPSVFEGMEERRYRFLHLDLDLYEPTMAALHYYYPRMSAGGLILCDDYGFTTCRGAKKAMDSFFEKTGEVVVPLSSGQAFVIKTNRREMRKGGFDE